MHGLLHSLYHCIITYEVLHDSDQITKLLEEKRVSRSRRDDQVHLNPEDSESPVLHDKLKPLHHGTNLN